MKIIDGGVCAPEGFTANGINVGIKPGQTRLDLGMIYSVVPAAAAAVYTTNLVKGAPITVTKENLSAIASKTGYYSLLRQKYKILPAHMNEPGWCNVYQDYLYSTWVKKPIRI